MKQWFMFQDRAHVFLFLASISVIFITLGIIETLLGESLEFFKEIAAQRGWFSFTWDVSALFDSRGLLALTLLGCALGFIVLERVPKAHSIIPEVMYKMEKKNQTWLQVSLIMLSFIMGGLWFALTIVVLSTFWNSLSNHAVKSRSATTPTNPSFSLKNIYLGLGLLFLFISTTTAYGGAIGEYFFTTQWTPTGACADRRTLCESMAFGANSLLFTTIQVAFGALLIAVPLGVGCAIFLSEYAPPRLVSVVKPTLELLAGVPSVVYGFFAFIYIGPIVVDLGMVAFERGWIDEAPNILNAVNGAIVVGIMILPLVASMSEDALRAVPNELREGSLALGATKIETTLFVMLQASLSGIVASIILALSRAVGETMAVTLAVGTAAVFTTNMFQPAQTMTAYIAQKVAGDLSYGEIGYLSIFAIGLYLFFITLSLNLIGNKILTNYREAY